MPTGQEHYELDFDPKTLNRFIFLFNIARHHARSYPSDHPQIAKSVQNFLALLDTLLEYRDEITIGVQVQGKRRGEITIAKDASQDDAMAAALADRAINKWLEGMQVVKVILVPGRLLNIVVKPA